MSILGLATTMTFVNGTIIPVVTAATSSGWPIRLSGLLAILWARCLMETPMSQMWTPERRRQLAVKARPAV